MAQHDYIIANQSGAAFRSDLNNGLAAIVSQNSGAAQPSTTYAYQWWADTTTGLLKLRNAANNAWITVGTLADANLGLAPLASPTLTGTPAAPTASVGTNTTQLATTAFVLANSLPTTGGTLTGNLTVPSLNGGPLAGFRNRIINGNFNIAQRGTSFAAIANSTYSLDRWAWGQAGAMVCTVTQNTDVPNNTFQSSYKVDVTTADTSIAAGDYVFVSQKIEGYDVRDLIGTTFTVSFWVKSPKTGVHCVSFSNSGQNRSYIKEYAVAAANTWEYKTVTIAGGLITAGTWNWTNGEGLEVGFSLASGSTYQTTADAWQTGDFLATANQVNVMDNTSNDFFLTGVQLEPGAVATPFEQRPIGTELALCQRYYCQTRSTVRAYNAAANAVAHGNHSYFPATMRTAPSITMTATVSERANVNAAYPQATNISVTGFTATIVSTGGTQEFYDNDRTWTASAEL